MGKKIREHQIQDWKFKAVKPLSKSYEEDEVPNKKPDTWIGRNRRERRFE